LTLFDSRGHRQDATLAGGQPQLYYSPLVIGLIFLSTSSVVDEIFSEEDYCSRY